MSAGRESDSLTRETAGDAFFMMTSYGDNAIAHGDRKARRRRTEDQDNQRKARKNNYVKNNYEIYLERKRKREEEDRG